MSWKRTPYLFFIVIITMLWISCKTTHQENAVAGEIIVQITKKANKEMVERDFSTYSFTHKKTLSKSLNTHLSTYDTLKIKPKKLVTMLKKMNDVLEAQPNRVVENRT